MSKLACDQSWICALKCKFHLHSAKEHSVKTPFVSLCRILSKSAKLSCSFGKHINRCMWKHTKMRARPQLGLGGKHKLFLYFFRLMKHSLVLLSSPCMTQRKAQENLKLSWVSSWRVFVSNDLALSGLKLCFYLILQVPLNPNPFFAMPCSKNSFCETETW